MNTDEREFSLIQVGEKNGIQFTLAHDIMFGMVMQDKDVCKGLLERIFPERKVKELKFCSHSNVELQKAINTGAAVYRFENFDKKNRLPLGDDSYKLVLNTSCPVGRIPPELRSFFAYVNRMEIPKNSEISRSRSFAASVLYRCGM